MYKSTAFSFVYDLKCIFGEAISTLEKLKNLNFSVRLYTQWKTLNWKAAFRWEIWHYTIYQNWSTRAYVINIWNNQSFYELRPLPNIESWLKGMD
jgi:hypothetical protein